TPLPQTGEQSRSLTALQPGGQQPSGMLEQAVTGACTQCAWQSVPCTESVVHGLLSLQSAGVGHLAGPLAMPVSHWSPPSSTPLAHVAEQSRSLLGLQVAGQHPSFAVPMHWVIAACEQSAVQLLAEPEKLSVVQESLSLQLATFCGQLDGGSQVSPAST